MTVSGSLSCSNALDSFVSLAKASSFIMLACWRVRRVVTVVLAAWLVRWDAGVSTSSLGFPARFVGCVRVCGGKEKRVKIASRL